MAHKLWQITISIVTTGTKEARASTLTRRPLESVVSVSSRRIGSTATLLNIKDAEYTAIRTKMFGADIHATTAETSPHSCVKRKTSYSACHSNLNGFKLHS